MSSSETSDRLKRNVKTGMGLAVVAMVVGAVAFVLLHSVGKVSLVAAAVITSAIMAVEYYLSVFLVLRKRRVS